MIDNASQTLESMSQAAWYNQWTLKKFEKYLKGRILEVGCGIGNFTNTLAKFGEVVAIDINKDYLTKISGEGTVGFGDIEKGEYFFKEEKFDSIVCLNVLEHINDDNKALKNLYGLLKKNGYLILLIPAHPLLLGEIDKSIGHFRRYTKKQITKELMDAGFKIISSKILNALGAIGWFIQGKIFKKTKVEVSGIKLFNIFAPIFLSLEDIIEPPFGTSILIVAQKNI